VSVNRTDSDSVVPIGGPSVAIAPDGEVMVETTDPVACVTLSGKAVEAARREYPGYLPVRADLYARAWAGIARE
jgi:predicted amidohydrolase